MAVLYFAKKSFKYLEKKIIKTNIYFFNFQ